MAQELLYTSARKGLRLGTRGYCTVAHTRGMPASTVRLLESLSAYKNAFPGHAPQASLNPVAISHHRAGIRGENVSILSRVGPSGRDHTNRDNKIAHHIVLGTGDRPSGGPAWLAAQPIFTERWEGPPTLIQAPKTIPHGDANAGVARAWEALTGDPGLGGVPAHMFADAPGRVV